MTSSISQALQLAATALPTMFIIIALFILIVRLLTTLFPETKRD